MKPTNRYSIVVALASVFLLSIGNARADDPALITAIAEGRVEVAKSLIQKGADVNVKAEDGYTPLHGAVTAGHTEIAKLLIQNGASLDTKGEKGNTALHFSAWLGRAEITKLLIENGADVSAKNNDSVTPSHLAAAQGYAHLVKLLKEPSCQSYMGQTIETHSFEAVEQLLSKVPEKKDEFETTESFQKKIDVIRADWPENFFISYDFGDTNTSRLNYDADNQHFKIHERTFDGSKRDASLMFYPNSDKHSNMGLRSYKEIDYGNSQIEFVVASAMKGTDAYVASNSLGASVTVVRVEQITHRVFERKIDWGEETFLGQESYFSQIGTLDIPPTEAKKFKQDGKAALLIAPAEPYFATGERKKAPTISSPLDVTENISIIIADIQCAFLIDESSKVLGTFSVN